MIASKEIAEAVFARHMEEANKIQSISERLKFIQGLMKNIDAVPEFSASAPSLVVPIPSASISAPNDAENAFANLSFRRLGLL